MRSTQNVATPSEENPTLQLGVRTYSEPNPRLFKAVRLEDASSNPKEQSIAPPSEESSDLLLGVRVVVLNPLRSKL